MMKLIKVIILCLFPLMAFSQNDMIKKYEKAEILLHQNKLDSALIELNYLEKNLALNDTLYHNTILFKLMINSYLEEAHRLNAEFAKSLEFGQQVYEGLRNAEEFMNEDFNKRQYFAIKNIIVSNVGVGNFSEAKKWKEKLYKANMDGLLPEGMDEYFNFDFFKFEDKNIWGYEWFEELPEDRFSKSFTKVVYYVYSTNEDGSDKDQLYRLHVLMFHGNNPNFDYVMDKKYETATNEVSGTMYDYQYMEDIDFEKLQKDVKEIIKGNLQTDTKRTTITPPTKEKKKKKKGKKKKK